MTRERVRRIRFVAVVTAVAVAAAVAIPFLAGGFTYDPGTTTESQEGRSASPTPVPSASTPARSSSSTPLDLGRPRTVPVVTADAAWVGDRATRTGIPVPAVRAYAAATIRQRLATPSCGLGWTTLAAIGAVETHHGTIDGASLADDGKALPRITGLPLNGKGLAAVPDTDGGIIDGDARWDRAVGPMQFIPQTWADWGVDADGDGVADPDDIDDAAAAAAAYLCADGHDLADHQGWIEAVGSYNHQEDYVRHVAEETNRLNNQ